MSLNILAIATNAMNLTHDAMRLCADVNTGNIDDAVAAVQDALPALAAVTSTPLEEMQGLLTSERVKASLEVEQAVQHLVQAIARAKSTQVAQAVIPQVADQPALAEA